MVAEDGSNMDWGFMDACDVFSRWNPSFGSGSCVCSQELSWWHDCECDDLAGLNANDARSRQGLEDVQRIFQSGCFPCKKRLGRYSQMIRLDMRPLFWRGMRGDG